MAHYFLSFIVFSLIVVVVSSIHHLSLPHPISMWTTKSNKSPHSKAIHPNKKMETFLRLRGGASSSSSSVNDDKDGNGKIKGVCIGIDLGTTYRYVYILS